VLRSDDCKASTGIFRNISTQTELEEAMMINRTLLLDADLDLIDTIYVLLGASEVALTGLVIDGGGVYSVDGSDAVRCFFVYGSGMEVTFQDVTISNGYASSSSLGSNNGGAVYVGGSSAVRMSGVTITSSSAASTGSGGALYVASSSLVMVDSVMSSNYAYYGGCIGAGASSEVTLTRVTMSSNRGYDGGGYYASSTFAALSMTGCTVTSNTLTSGNHGSGAGLYIGDAMSSATLDLTDCAFTSNSASYYGYGGGIEISTSVEFYFTRCTFDSNYARYDGGALRVGAGATGTLTDCTFRNNHAYRYGGAIDVYTWTTTLTFLSFEFVDNYATGSSHEDIWRANSATLNFVVGCSEGSYNYGSSWLECPNCASLYLPAVLLSDDCKATTGMFANISTQTELEEAMMTNRTLLMDADIDLTDTIYMFRGVSEVALTGLVVDGGGVYTVDGSDAVRCFFVYGSGMEVTFQDVTISNGFASSSSLGSNNGGAVYVGGSSAVRMSGVTITSSSAASTGSGGAVYVASSSLVMVDSVMSSNYAYYGGCIGAGASSEVTLTRVTMSSNTGYDGGGYYSSSTFAALSMTGCTVTSNTLTSGNYGSGGGLYIGDAMSSATLDLTDCALTSNSAPYLGYGGGIDISTSVEFYFTRCTFDSNYARYDGGALRVGAGATGILTDCTFSYNHAYRYGGAIQVFTYTSTLAFINYEFDGNYDSSSSHDDIYRVNSATLNFEISCPDDTYNFGSRMLVCPNCAFTYLPAELHSVSCKSTTGTFTNITTQSELEEALMINRTLVLDADIDLTDTVYIFLGISEATLIGLVIDGVGLYSVDGGDAVRCFFLFTSSDDYYLEITFLDLTLSNGQATSASLDGSLGGAVYARSSIKLTFSGVTISSSSASYGSGIYVASSSVLHMDYCTFYYNQGATSGGGLYFAGTTAYLAHIDFLSNYAVTGGGAYFSAGTVSLIVYTFLGNSGTTGADVYVSSSSTLLPGDGCSRGTYNYGTGILVCSGCTNEYLPADLFIQRLIPTPFPTPVPSPVPTPLPSSLPSSSPTELPSPVPSILPTISFIPSALPSSSPTLLPSNVPSLEPTPIPTHLPTVTSNPTILPSPVPTSGPSPTPTVSSPPTIMPVPQPTLVPTQTHAPSLGPSATPSQRPTFKPSKSLTSRPFLSPSSSDSRPSPQPSSRPSVESPLQPASSRRRLAQTLTPSSSFTSPKSANTSRPSSSPSSLPEAPPSPLPSSTPTALPLLAPTPSPSSLPSSTPSALPSQAPTLVPSFFFPPTSEPTSSFMHECALPTPEADVNTEATLEASLMHNRTVYLGADIYLSATFYILIGLNERLNFVLDGKDLWKIDGRNAVRCMFIVGSGVEVGLKDLIVTNGYAASSTTNGYYGGAIYVGDGAIVNMEGCTVSSSRTATYGRGAGIYIDNAVVALVDTVVEFNVIYRGKGAGISLASSSVLTMSGGSIKYNFARSYDCYTVSEMEGGGLYIDGGAIATISDASIAHNIAYKGGGVFVASYGELVLRDTPLTSNSYIKTYLSTTYYAWYRSSCSTSYAYQSFGGGIFSDSNTKVALIGSKISNNAAYSYGGGVYFSSGTYASISASTITSNYARYRGGGIYSSYATIAMNDSAIESNSLGGTGSRYQVHIKIIVLFHL
jgi:hypothetical protein